MISRNVIRQCRMLCCKHGAIEFTFGKLLAAIKRGVFMRDSSHVIFRTWAIKLTVLVESLVLLGFCWLILKYGINLFSWITPVLFCVAVAGMKLAAPRIPQGQLLTLLVFVIAIPLLTTFLGKHLSPLFFFTSDIVIPLACVFGFGAYWVKQGYIPAAANRW